MQNIIIKRLLILSLISVSACTGVQGSGNGSNSGPRFSLGKGFNF